MGAGMVAAVALMVSASALRAEVVRPAPAFATLDGKSLDGFRGQPVVLLIADSPKNRALRRQLRRIEAVYSEFEARRAVFVVAFTRGPADAPIASSLPLLKVARPIDVAARYGIGNSSAADFAVAVIGRDGNLDFILPKAVPAATLMDMIINNGEQQAEERK